MVHGRQQLNTADYHNREVTNHTGPRITGAGAIVAGPAGAMSFTNSGGFPIDRRGSTLASPSRFGVQGSVDQKERASSCVATDASQPGRTRHGLGHDQVAFHEVRWQSKVEPGKVGRHPRGEHAANHPHPIASGGANKLPSAISFCCATVAR